MSECFKVGKAVLRQPGSPRRVVHGKKESVILRLFDMLAVLMELVRLTGRKSTHSAAPFCGFKKEVEITAARTAQAVSCPP
ncbi:unnamed protein product [Gongylonema pulchrum]|uniref:Uncharacterized protein n=1 Tax=Gongylonema pulchrum TaxID=637853 RepID=A0A183D1H9_9BILA|nr:unnamed protein product [Gongylonema pulchrum]